MRASRIAQDREDGGGLRRRGGVDEVHVRRKKTRSIGERGRAPVEAALEKKKIDSDRNLQGKRSPMLSILAERLLHAEEKFRSPRQSGGKTPIGNDFACSEQKCQVCWKQESRHRLDEKIYLL